jgi:6-pyruvoyltetrahydropterin/6-carboxytetrahydropterin synthase
MPWRISKKFTFEASHQLPLHDGKCARLHGHSWVGYVVCEGPFLVSSGPKVGMLIDFADVLAAVQPLVQSSLDHWHLNDSTGLANPTSEELARWIYERVKPLLPNLYSIVIEETCTSKAEYRPDF